MKKKQRCLNQDLITDNIIILKLRPHALLQYSQFVSINRSIFVYAFEGIPACEKHRKDEVRLAMNKTSYSPSYFRFSLMSLCTAHMRAA